VHNASWWDQAQVRDVARAYETAVTFRDEDQAARDAESRIRQELRERYDVEVLETGADPAVVRATLVDRDTERAERDERQAQARDDQDLAAGLVVGAEVLEVSADLADAEEAQDLRDLAADVEHDAELSWDSAERRELHVERIKAGPDQAAAATAWKQADVDQARHPREAVQGGRKGKSPRTRVAASTPDRQIGRDGR
jgi:colicin import membrane protein